MNKEQRWGVFYLIPFIIGYLGTVGALFKLVLLTEGILFNTAVFGICSFSILGWSFFFLIRLITTIRDKRKQDESI